VRRATAAIGDAVDARRAGRASRRRVVRLDDVRRRLELLVTAVYDRPIPIAAAEKPKGRAWSIWMEPFAPRHLQRNDALPTTDGQRIQLPREITGPDADTALAQYRLMAIEQAERIVRGTTTRVPDTATPAERDLYLRLLQLGDERYLGPLPVNDQGGRLGNQVDEHKVADGRLARFAVVHGKRTEDCRSGSQDRDRPAGAKTVRQGEVAEIGP